MPVYEYMCRDCGKVSELLVKTMSGDDNKFCPHCGSGEMEKLMSVPALLKGNVASPGHTCCGRMERCETPPCSTDKGCRRR